MALEITNQFIVFSSCIITMCHCRTNTTAPSASSSTNSFGSIADQLTMIDPLIWIIIGLIVLVCCVCSLFIAFCVAERYLRHYKREFDLAETHRISIMSHSEPTISLSPPAKPRTLDKTNSISVISRPKTAPQMMPLSRSKSTPTLHNNQRSSSRQMTTEMSPIPQLSPLDLEAAPPMTRMVRSQSHAVHMNKEPLQRNRVRSNTLKFKMRSVNEPNYKRNGYESEYSNTISDNPHNNRNSVEFKRAKTLPMNYQQPQWNRNPLAAPPQKQQLQSIPSEKESPPRILQPQQDKLPPIPSALSQPLGHRAPPVNMTQNQQNMMHNQMRPMRNGYCAPQHVQSGNLQTQQRMMVTVPPPPPQLQTTSISTKIHAQPQQKVPPQQAISIIVPQKENRMIQQLGAAMEKNLNLPSDVNKKGEGSPSWTEETADGTVVKLADHTSDGIVGMMNMFSNDAASSGDDACSEHSDLSDGSTDVQSY